MSDSHSPQPVMNPYLAGFGLGLVLLSSFVVMGWGLGASSAFAALLARGLDCVVPSYVAGNPFLSGYLDESALWTVMLVAGVFVGGLVSGLLAHRSKIVIEHGPRWTPGLRLAFAFVGGAIMALGARIGGGCTSGQALTGGAQLNAGSWAFMICVFGGAYALAYLVRKQWI